MSTCCKYQRKEKDEIKTAVWCYDDRDNCPIDPTGGADPGWVLVHGWAVSGKKCNDDPCKDEPPVPKAVAGVGLSSPAESELTEIRVLLAEVQGRLAVLERLK